MRQRNPRGNEKRQRDPETGTGPRKKGTRKYHESKETVAVTLEPRLEVQRKGRGANRGRSTGEENKQTMDTERNTGRISGRTRRTIRGELMLSIAAFGYEEERKKTI